MLTMALASFSTAWSQPASNPTEKGNKQAGLQVMLAWTDMYNSYTTLSIDDNNKSYGINMGGLYGWFLERNWMVGLQANVGAYRDSYAKGEPYGYDEKGFDISLTPITRYYFTVDKKHRFKPFLFAGLPVVYSSMERESGSGGPGNYQDETLNLRASFGVGAAYFGRAGSLELNVSNMGFFFGVNKFIPSRRK